MANKESTNVTGLEPSTNFEQDEKSLVKALLEAADYKTGNEDNIKKIFVKTYYSLTKDDNIINRIKENKLYGINKTSTKYFDDILSSPRRRIK